MSGVWKSTFVTSLINSVVFRSLVVTIDCYNTDEDDGNDNEETEAECQSSHNLYEGNIKVKLCDAHFLASCATNLYFLCSCKDSLHVIL